jgi:hypothetical protein
MSDEYEYGQDDEHVLMLIKLANSPLRARLVTCCVFYQFHHSISFKHFNTSQIDYFGGGRLITPRGADVAAAAACSVPSQSSR